MCRYLQIALTAFIAGNLCVILNLLFKCVAFLYRFIVCEAFILTYPEALTVKHSYLPNCNLVYYVSLQLVMRHLSHGLRI